MHFLALLLRFSLCQTDTAELRVNKDGVGDKAVGGCEGGAAVEEIAFEDAEIVIGDVGECCLYRRARIFLRHSFRDAR